jgi:hypothetical protein
LPVQSTEKVLPLSVARAVAASITAAWPSSA